MGNKEGKKKKGCKKQIKNDLPVFESNHDFLKAFEKKYDRGAKDEGQMDPLESMPENKHGVKVLDALPGNKSFTDTIGEEDFARLLEASFKKGKVKSGNKTRKMPLNKRLKRYPPVEVDLDLHGYSAIGAQVKTRSFIRNCKHQGFFTVRIIVGKGLHSDLGPVLPDIVEDVVRQMKKQDRVIAYEWDQKKKSKSGAVIVYLKQFEQFD